MVLLVVPVEPYLGLNHSSSWGVVERSDQGFSELNPGRNHSSSWGVVESGTDKDKVDIYSGSQPFFFTGSD